MQLRTEQSYKKKTSPLRYKLWEKTWRKENLHGTTNSSLQLILWNSNASNEYFWHWPTGPKLTSERCPMSCIKSDVVMTKTIRASSIKWIGFWIVRRPSSTIIGTLSTPTAWKGSTWRSYGRSLTMVKAMSPISFSVNWEILLMLPRQSPEHCGMLSPDTISLVISCMSTLNYFTRSHLWKSPILAYSLFWGNRITILRPTSLFSVRRRGSMVQRTAFVRPQTRNAWRCITNFTIFFGHDFDTIWNS